MFRHNLDGITLPYAEIYVQNNVTGDTVGTAKEQVLRFVVDGESFNAIPDYNNDHITIKRPGRYLVNCHVCVKSVDAQSIVLHVVSWKNNGATELVNIHGHTSFTAGQTTSRNVAMSGIHNFSMNDTLELWMSTNADRDLVLIDVSLTVSWLGV